ncbi:Mariner Mos1 transposase [Araneus ventricosus]|uniref:Mariner Mos1 transposase n=1 Tax=Araneus ventricosus TaxID=182803 RepID=A0A4Y2DT00_ARAVE|nr:Mariner Mos1 transposase [Araneus ventricosus]
MSNIKNALEALLHKDLCQALSELEESLGIDHTTVLKHLKALGMIQKQCHWVLYQLKPRDVEQRLFTCEQLLQKRKGFLHHVVTGNEKWIHYDNSKLRKSWYRPSHASTSCAKPNMHSSKLLLFIWWDQLGVVYYELLKLNETITGDRYRLQFDAFETSIKGKMAAIRAETC